jgi:ribosomal protein S11
VFIKKKKKKKYSKFIIKKIKKKKGVPKISSEFISLLIRITKRNIFSTVTDYKGNILSSISIGILHVRGKERNTNYAIESTAEILCKKITELNKGYIICTFEGKSNIRKKRRFLKALRDKTPTNMLKIQRFSTRSHNGCRPSKVRRL